MGPTSVDAMLTFPRPLLCCCSCFRPPGTAGVWIRPSPPFPIKYPVHRMCAMYIVMRWGAHGRAYACTRVCMGLASQQAASEARLGLVGVLSQGSRCECQVRRFSLSFPPVLLLAWVPCCSQPWFPAYSSQLSFSLPPHGRTRRGACHTHVYRHTHRHTHTETNPYTKTHPITKGGVTPSFHEWHFIWPFDCLIA